MLYAFHAINKAYRLLDKPFAFDSITTSYFTESPIIMAADLYGAYEAVL